MALTWFLTRQTTRLFLSQTRRSYSALFPSSKRKGLVLGIYTEGSGDSQEFKLTSTGNKFNQQLGGKLEDLLRLHGSYIPKGEVQVFQNVESEFYSIAVAGLGKEDVGFNTLENLDECRENVRVAAGAGARALSSLGTSMISVEGFGQAEAAAEGAALATWRFQDFKAKEDHKSVPHLELFMDADSAGWQRGLLKADAQNLARNLCDTPANIMTPSAFARAAVEALCPCGVGVEVRDKDWIESKKLNAFLAVAKGSSEPPIFLELGYCGGQQDERPIVLVGKGITYDSGGLCLKKCKQMSEFKGDMAGAAVIVATMKAIASLTLPINVQALIPLCENMPSGMSMKPGDILFAHNGASIQVEDTSNEGRIILADALGYAREAHKPRLMIDVATLSMGMRSALGGAASGVYTNNHDLWREINKAGSITGDRVWRFPLWHHFTKKVTYITNADVTNTGMGPGGSPCRAAAFLKEFVPCGDWVHLDITSCGMECHSADYPYLKMRRMTGRPTRTLIQFLYQIACPPDPKVK
ncbi:cytosol aminopeptidase-like isoform X1 [Periplaneta americana]|uniref:cytosol aminopeptidase-like isoform X1 n=2 Tax=Periplaneta americana TaxID=6978 RepID=UPI0037E7E445